MVKCRHTPSPTGYLNWHVWAEKRSETYKQSRCSNCGLWAIWKPKKIKAKSSTIDSGEGKDDG